MTEWDKCPPLSPVYTCRKEGQKEVKKKVFKKIEDVGLNED